MLTQTYHKKIDRFIKFYKFVYRYRALIISFLTLLGATGATLMSLEGVIIKDLTVQNSVYGDSYEFSAESLYNNDARIQYSLKGNEAWSYEKPVNAGEYEARVVTTNIFGGQNYSKPQSFTIAPKEVTPVLKDNSITWGENAIIDIEGLIEGDKLGYQSYSLVDPTSDNPTLSLSESSFIIENEKGENVTSNYKINYSALPIKIEPREISISSYSFKEYDGTAILAGNNLKLTRGSLAKGDKLELVKSNSSLTNVGELTGSEASFDYRIVNETYGDVTKLYSVNLTSSLEVTQRELTIDIPDYEEKEYDGKSLTIDPANYKISAGNLAQNDTILLEFNSYTNAGSYEIEPLKVSVLNDKNEDVSANYNIKVNTGTCTINKRKVTVSTESKTISYDGSVHGWEDFEKDLENPSYAYREISDGSLIDEDELVVTTEFTTGTSDVGSYDIDIDFDIVNKTTKESNITNYDVTKKFGDFVINKQDLNIKTKDFTVTYNGNAGDDAINYSDIEVSGLAPTDKIGNVTPNSWSNPEYGVNTTYQNVVSVQVIDKTTGEDRTDNYNINYDFGTITFLPREISVSTPDAEISYENFISGGEKPFSSPSINLINGTSLGVNDQIEITNYASISEPGSVENIVDFKIIRNANIQGQSVQYDVTQNYTITNTSYGTLTMLPERFEYLLFVNNYGQAYDCVITNTEGEAQTVSESDGYYHLTKNQTYYFNCSVYEGYEISEVSLNNIEILNYIDGKGYEFVMPAMDFASINVYTKEIEEVEPPNPGGDDGEGENPGGDENPGGGETGDDDNQDDPEDEGAVDTVIDLTGGSVGEGGLDIDGKPINIFNFTLSGHNQRVYFRQNVYGDYKTDGTFELAQNYEVPSGDINPNNYISNLVKAAGEPTYNITVGYSSSFKKDIAPFYFASANNPNISTNDNEFDLNDQTYNQFSIVDYDYVQQHNDGISTSTDSLALNVGREKYQEFVSQNYLNVPASLKTVTQNIIDTNSLKKDNQYSTITSVVDYLKSSGGYSYNLNAEYEAGTDILAEFLETKKEGICSHFAGSATMIFRTLGYPARTVGGFTSQGEQDKLREVTVKEAHAWCEVYIDELSSWVIVDPTPSANVPGGGGGTSGDKPIDPGEGEDPDEGENPGEGEKPDIGEDDKPDGNKDPEEGEGEKPGEDGDFPYNPDEVTRDELDPDINSLKFISKSLTFEYSGEALPIEEYELVSGELLPYDKYYCTPTTTIIDTKNGDKQINSFYVRIRDTRTGEDVTKEYENLNDGSGIIKEEGSVIVKQAKLDAISPDLSKAYDGTPLVCTIDDLLFGENKLKGEDKITKVTFVSNLTQVGSVVNFFKINQISRGKNPNCLQNYYINYAYGTLTIY